MGCAAGRQGSCASGRRCSRRPPRTTTKRPSRSPPPRPTTTRRWRGARARPRGFATRPGRGPQGRRREACRGQRRGRRDRTARRTRSCPISARNADASCRRRWTVCLPRLASRILGVDVTTSEWRGSGSRMSTFIGQLSGSRVIVGILWSGGAAGRKMMHEPAGGHAHAARRERGGSQEARRRGRDARQGDRECQGRGRQGDRRGRADSERIAEQLREQAGIEAERIKAKARNSSAAARSSSSGSFAQAWVSESVRKAGELVRDHVADPAAQSATVDRFLDELDEMASSEASIETGATTRLRCGQPRRARRTRQRVRRRSPADSRTAG